VLASAARRSCRISSAYDWSSANDGHAAITRPVAVGSATETFAARLATLPTANSVHGKKGAPGPPDRDSAGNVVDAATIIPSTGISGVSAASKCMCR
jgi:hypothetical protein